MLQIAPAREFVCLFVHKVPTWLERREGDGDEKEGLAGEPTSCKIIKMKKETNVSRGSYFKRHMSCRIWASEGVVFSSTKGNRTWVFAWPISPAASGSTATSEKSH